MEGNAGSGEKSAEEVVKNYLAEEEQMRRRMAENEEWRKECENKDFARYAHFRRFDSNKIDRVTNNTDIHEEVEKIRKTLDK